MNDRDETIERPQGPNVAEAETVAPGEPATELVRVLDKYMAAIEAGEAPDRAGLLAAHPGLAAQLEPCLAGIDFIHRVARPEGSGAEPAMLGEFRIVREVGRGGMGVVYEAEQTSLRRRVALKVLRFGVVADEEALRRFRVEAETVARLHHTNIVPIFAVGTEHDVSYYAMQFIEGKSLADVQEESRRAGRPLPVDDIARWGLQATDALAHAHQRRVIHRDIKPSNLLIDAEGVVWLTDFGLAKRSDEVTLTLSGTLMGTPRYMSPEQAEAMKRPVDHRTDLYSLGASLYELATGRPVFESATTHGVIMQVLTADPVAPRSVRADIPRDFETILLTCLAKDPDRRYATAQALAQDLRLFLEGRAIKARRTPVWEKMGRWAKRQKKSVAIGAIAAVASIVMAGAGLALWLRQENLKLGRLNLSTQGEPLTAEILQPDRDEPVGEPFTVPTRSPVAIPEGDYRVRLSAPGKLSETYQLRLERWLPQDYQVDLSQRDLWSASKHEDTQKTWRAYPLSADARVDLIEVDQQSISRVTCDRKPVWTFKSTAKAQLPAGAELGDWENLLFPERQPPRFVEQPPGVLESMPDMNGDGIGDIVIWSRQTPFVFTLSGKDGKVLWHRRLATDDVPKTSFRSRSLGQPLIFHSPEGPVLVVTFDLDKSESEDVLVRRVEAIDGRTGLPIWHRESAPRFDRMVPAQMLRVAGKDVVGVVFGGEWSMLDRMTGSLIGPALNFGELLPDRSQDSPCRAIRQPLVADLDGDGSDDLIVLLEGLDANHPVLMAISLSDRRRLWSSNLETPDPRFVDQLEPEATWPRLADLDGDGRPEVLVPYQVNVGPANSRRRSIGIRAIDGRDGSERWSHRMRTDRDIDASAQFLTGPDVDGDGARDVFVASFLRDDNVFRGNLNPGTLFVDALSGRDGRSLWWWSISLLCEDYLVRPLRWWEAGPDGFPKLVVDAGSDVVAFREIPSVFMLAASTGRLLHQESDFIPTGSADLDRDGIPELWGTSTYQATPAGVRRLVVSGRPSESWKRLGRWEVGRDYDRDGVADLVGPAAGRHNEVDAISGRDGHVLWQATPDQSSAMNRGGTEGPLFCFVPLPEKLGDLDGDDVPDVVLTRDGSRRHFRGGQLTVGLGVCSGRTGKILWENPEVPFDYPNYHPSVNLCAAWNVMALDVEGRGRSDLLALLYIEAGRVERNVAVNFAEFHLARFSGETGHRLAFSRIAVRNEGPGPYHAKPDRDFASAVVDMDGDGATEIVFELPHVASSGQLTSEFVAARAIDGEVVWRHEGAMRLDGLNSSADAWSRFAAADLDGDGKAEIVLIDVVEGRPRIERWDIASRTAPRWIWRGDDSEGGVLREVSAIPRLVTLDGTGRKAIVVVADQEKAGRRVVVLDALGRVIHSRPIDSKGVGHRIWAGDLDGDGKDEVLFEDRAKLCAARVDLAAELWTSPIIDRVKEIRPGPGGGTAVVLENGVALDGATGRPIFRTGRLGHFKLIDGPDPSRPMAVEILPAVTSAFRTRPEVATSAMAGEPVAGHPDPGDPRVVRPLPWVVGSPGGLQKDRPYLPAVAFYTFAAGFYSLVVLVGPVVIIGKMIRRKGRIKHLLVFPVSVAAAFACYSLFRSDVSSNWTGLGFPPSLAAIWMVMLAIAGLPMLAILVAAARALKRRSWGFVPGSLALWAAGCLISAALLIYLHQRDWMVSGERYGWEGWWTIWLPGLYVAGCLLIAYQVVYWPLSRLGRLVRSSRAVA